MTSAPCTHAPSAPKSPASIVSSIVIASGGAFASAADCTEDFDLVYDFVEKVFGFPPFGLCARTLAEGHVFLAPFEP